MPVCMAFIVAAMMFCASANAQIVYTDLNPDITSGSSNPWSYNLDLNNDGTTDFVITDTSATVLGGTNCGGTQTNRYISITPLGSNEVVNDSSSLVTKLTLNTQIDSSTLTWNNISNQILRSYTFSCVNDSASGWVWYGYTSGPWHAPFNSAANGFVGLKLATPGNIYYGWVQLSVAVGAVGFTVKDYAYNSIPNQSILAGQTTVTGINENAFASSIYLFPNPANNHLTIDLGSNNKNVEVTITDITGKIIPIDIGIGENKIEVNTTELAEGIYIVKIQSAGFIGTKRLVVEK